jgi:Family of unknown function (DUF5709)
MRAFGRPGYAWDMSENIGEDPGDSTTENETYNSYSVDDEDQPQGEGDSLVSDRGLTEPLDEGYSPPEKWSAGEGYGNTPYEEEVGESLDQRIAQEEPEPDPYEEAATEVENVSGEVGNERAGRLVDEDQGLGPDEEKDLVGEDVGIDGAGASAEEAAVHVIDDDR